MKYQSFIAILAAALAVASSSCNQKNQTDYTSPEPPPLSASGWQFICREGKKNGKLLPPTTYAWRPEGKKALVRWEKDVFEAMGYPAKTRCEQVSPRFQEAYDNGTLKYMTNGTWKDKNGKEQPVICAASVKDGDCETLLFTLRHKDDSKQILDQLNEVIQGSSSKPVGHDSGVSDQIYIKVDLEEFLRNAPDE